MVVVMSYRFLWEKKMGSCNHKYLWLRHVLVLHSPPVRCLGGNEVIDLAHAIPIRRMDKAVRVAGRIALADHSIQEVGY